MTTVINSYFDKGGIMKAAVFKKSGLPLSIEDIEEPRPQPTDMVIRVCACGICGTDLHWSEINNEDSGFRDIHPGAVMGHEFSGEIVELGKDVREDWKIGDRVCAMPQIGCASCENCLVGRPHRCARGVIRATPGHPGAYAEYTRIGARETFRLPDHVTFQEGALVEPLAVGLHAVKRAQLKPGDNVLIVGGGPVGLSVAVWCKFFGARHIVVSDLAKDRAEKACDFGATAAIDASAENVSEAFQKMVGSAPTVVFDAVGIAGSMQLSISYAPNYGRVVVVGLCMVSDKFEPAEAVVKEVDIAFCFCYERIDFEMTIEMLSQNRIQASGLVTKNVGFADFPMAFEDLKRPSDDIKVMLAPD
ncbi:MAG: alcohol dehydrogenase [Rhodospirillaceae bacterium]|nr:alcohol dehydrogenase [Rhodospirillaceae bacterium]|tara:strand:+ start:209 stop:1291 length:1083 start_codon:yes stop_codon:yes gene_type:complete